MGDYSGHDPEQPAANPGHLFHAVPVVGCPNCPPPAGPVRGGDVADVPVAERAAAAAVDAVLHGDETATWVELPDETPAEREPAGRDLFGRDQPEPAGRVIVEDRDGDRYLADDVPGAEFRFVSIDGPRFSWATLVTVYGPMRVVDDGATLPPLPGPPSVPGELVELERVAGPPMGPYECLVELVRLIKDPNVREVERLGAVVAGLAPFTAMAVHPDEQDDDR